MKKNKGLKRVLIVLAAVVAATVVYALLGKGHGQPVTTARPAIGTIIEKSRPTARYTP